MPSVELIQRYQECHPSKGIHYDLLAWSQGRHARRCGAYLATNPYPPRSRMAEAWTMGWSLGFTHAPDARRMKATPRLWHDANTRWRRCWLSGAPALRSVTLPWPSSAEPRHEGDDAPGLAIDRPHHPDRWRL